MVTRAPGSGLLVAVSVTRPEMRSVWAETGCEIPSAATMMKPTWAAADRYRIGRKYRLVWLFSPLMRMTALPVAAVIH
jgi:hypothetical protein